MKFKHLLYPALSLSVTLAACTPQDALQAPQSALAPADAPQQQATQATQQVSFTYRAPQAFNTQAIDLTAVKFIKLTLVGDGINGSLSTADFVAVVDGQATATINKVPIRAGKLRVVTVQGYDENKELLPAFVGKGYYKSQAGQTTVTLKIDRQRLATGLILEQLLQSNVNLANGINLETLQANIDTATGFSDNTFVIDPLQLDIQALVTQLLSSQTPTVGDIQDAARLGNIVLSIKTTGGGLFTEALTVEVNDPESTVQNIEVEATSPQNVKLGVAPGTWTARVKKADGTVIGTTPITVAADGSVTLDQSGIVVTLKPSIDSLSPSRGLEVGGTSVTLTGTGFTGATEVKFGDVVATNLNVVSDTQLTVNAPAGTLGNTTVTVTTPGGVSDAGSFSYVSNEVSAINPASGNIGTKVTLTGSGFDAVATHNVVKFGDVIANIDTQAQNSSTSLTVTVPAGISGSAEVAVTEGVNVGVGKVFSVLPTVTDLNVTSGSPAGGGTITVTGNGFETGASTVKFGDTDGTDVTVNSNTSLTATIPAGTPGEIDVTVVTEGGTSAIGVASKYIYTGLKSVFAGSNNAQDVIFANNQYVAVGGSVWTSPDGSNWTVHDTSAAVGDVFLGVTFGNNQYVAVGYGGEIITSPDGVTWTAQTSGVNRILNSVAYGNNQYVTVGSNGTIITSPDGITWTERTSGTSSSLQAVKHANNQYIAVGSEGTIITSSDGVTWTARISGISTNNNLLDVIYVNNQYITVGSEGTITTSSDGVTWTARTSGKTSFLRGIAFGNNQYVAVGSSGTLLTSPNGITWTAQDSDVDNYLGRIAFNSGKFVVISSFGPFFNSVGL